MGSIHVVCLFVVCLHASGWRCHFDLPCRCVLFCKVNYFSYVVALWSGIWRCGESEGCPFWRMWEQARATKGRKYIDLLINCVQVALLWMRIVTLMCGNRLEQWRLKVHFLINCVQLILLWIRIVAFIFLYCKF